MRDVLSANTCEENVARLHLLAVLDTVISVAHFDYAIQDNEHLLAIVDVPPIGLVRPVQAGRDAVHRCNRQGVPRVGAAEIRWPDELHNVFAVNETTNAAQVTTSSR